MMKSFASFPLLFVAISTPAQALQIVVSNCTHSWLAAACSVDLGEFEDADSFGEAWEVDLGRDPQEILNAEELEQAFLNPSAVEIPSADPNVLLLLQGLGLGPAIEQLAQMSGVGEGAGTTVWSTGFDPWEVRMDGTAIPGSSLHEANRILLAAWQAAFLSEAVLESLLFSEPTFVVRIPPEAALPVPEPSTLLLCLGGLVAFALGRRRGLLLVATLAGAIGAQPAQADSITFGFDGIVTFVSGEAPVSPGRAISGSYTFISYAGRSGSRWGNWYHRAITEAQLHVGEVDLFLDGTLFVRPFDLDNWIFVGDEAVAIDDVGKVDIYGVKLEVTEPELMTFALALWQPIDLGAPPSSAIVGEDLKTVPPDVSAFSETEIFVEISQAWQINAELTSLFIIPEPTTLALLAIGLAGLAVARKRCHQRPHERT